MTTTTTIEKLLKGVGLNSSLLKHLSLLGSTVPTVPSSFGVGHLAQASVSASALSAANLLHTRGGQIQDVMVDERHAVLEFAGEHYVLTDGKSVGDLWDPIAGPYATADGFVRIHTNFPHHRAGVIRLLGCADTRQEVSMALSRWRSKTFEAGAVDAGLCVTALRSFDEWDAHPQGRALHNIPPVEILKIGDAPRKTNGRMPSRPLDDIRVLDLTRVIAGPVAGKILAAHGADVLLVTSPELPSLPDLDIDTSRGKRTTQLDLTNEADRKTLIFLAQNADVFLQGYRPGGLEIKGFGVNELARLRPGIVYASIRAYGWTGPWANWRGFDSLTQTAAGLNFAEAEAYNSTLPDDEGKKQRVPLKALPVQALDHAAGQLLVLGINAALARTYTEGGSYEVRVSLAGVATFLRSLPRIPAHLVFGQNATAISLPPKDTRSPEIEKLSASIPFGPRAPSRYPISGSKDDRETLEAITHAGILSKTPVKLGEARRGLNDHSPEWLPRG